MSLATTFKGYLQQMQWYFHEKGMHRVYNELARLFNEQDDGTNVDFTGGAYTYYGDIVFADGTATPFVANGLTDPTEGRDGTGAIYPDKKYPYNGIGFTASL